jgi:hypothetical protein
MTDSNFYVYGPFLALLLIISCGYGYYRMYLKNDHRAVPPTVVAATFVTVDQSQDNCQTELFLLEAVALPTSVNFDDPYNGNDLIPEQTEVHIHAVGTSGPIIAQSCVAYI